MQIIVYANLLVFTRIYSYLLAFTRVNCIISYYFAANIYTVQIKRCRCLLSLYKNVICRYL